MLSKEELQPEVFLERSDFVVYAAASLDEKEQKLREYYGHADEEDEELRMRSLRTRHRARLQASYLISRLIRYSTGSVLGSAGSHSQRSTCQSFPSRSQRQ